MKKYKVLNCVCMDCLWVWKVLETKPSVEQECPDCKSFNVKTYLKLPKSIII